MQYQRPSSASPSFNIALLHSQSADISARSTVPSMKTYCELAAPQREPPGALHCRPAPKRLTVGLHLHWLAGACLPGRI